MPKIKKQKIVVAMSGGVDSSLAAALLKKAGFDVVGIFMKFWKEGKAGQNRCCSVESEKLARLVAKKIGIPFYVLNVEKEFKKQVVDYFLREYKKGNTPNPCVVCNKEIKFGLLVKKALALGADFVATGHYAKTSLGNEFLFGSGSTLRAGPAIASKNSLPRSVGLFQAHDKEKDQSYFLWQLNQKQLSRIMFPLADYKKQQVRALAKKFKLPTAETPESQEVCFIQNNTNEFLKKYLKTNVGKITDKTGKVLGTHQGLWFYTIGQRRGLEIPQGPYYAVKKDFKNNILVVSKDEKDLLQKEIFAENVNWISGEEKLPLSVKCKIRYKAGLADATIEESGKDKVKIIFKKPQKAATEGQSAVFYSKTGQLLGGGVII